MALLRDPHQSSSIHTQNPHNNYEAPSQLSLDSTHKEAETSIHEQTIAIDTKDETAVTPETTAKRQNVKSFLVLLREPAFVLYLAGQFVIYMGHLIPFTYTTPRAVLLGHSESRAAMLSSMIGISGIFGRFFPGLVGNKMSTYSKLYTCALSATVCAVLGVVSMLSGAYWFLACYSVGWGLFSCKII